MDPRDARIASLEAELTQTRKELAEAVALIKVMHAEVKFLKAKLNQDSSNSNQPPSTDKPTEKPTTAAPKPVVKRKPGAQRGHAFIPRKLLPIAPGDQVVPFFPTCSCGCKALKNLEQVDAFQRFDLPERPLLVTEFIRFRADCTRCDTQIEAQFPEELADMHAFGPRITGFVGVCSGKLSLSKRGTQWLLNEVFGLPICVGSICNLEAVVSTALLPVYTDIEKAAQVSPGAHCDETSWFYKGGLWWLWVMSTPKAVLFKVQSRRDTEAAKLLLQDFCGLLTTDRYGAYAHYPLELRQLCWAHLIRDFLNWELKGSKEASRLVFMTEVLFKSYHSMKDGTQRWKHFQVLARNVQRVMTDILGLVVKEELREVSGKATALLKEWEAAWRFVDKKGIEPTNNEAEQVIRRGVLWRKNSYGTKSETGNRYVERILSFIETMKRRGLAVFDELVKVVKAKEQGLPYRLATS